jgi:hypothetical protein
VRTARRTAPLDRQLLHARQLFGPARGVSVGLACPTANLFSVARLHGCAAWCVGNGPFRRFPARAVPMMCDQRIYLDPEVEAGLGRIVALHYCSSTLYQIREENWYLFF